MRHGEPPGGHGRRISSRGQESRSATIVVHLGAVRSPGAMIVCQDCTSGLMRGQSFADVGCKSVASKCAENQLAGG